MQENAQNTPAQSDTPQSVSADAPQNKCDTAQPAQASVPDRSCGAEVVNDAQAARQSTSLWRAAFRATVPVLCGYLALGSAFGLLLNAAGYGALAAGAMSVVLYAGSGQFLAAQMLASGATLVEMALADVLSERAAHGLWTVAAGRICARGQVPFSANVRADRRGIRAADGGQCAARCGSGKIQFACAAVVPRVLDTGQRDRRDDRHAAADKHKGP